MAPRRGRLAPNSNVAGFVRKDLLTKSRQRRGSILNEVPSTYRGQRGLTLSIAMSCFGQSGGSICGQMRIVLSGGL